MFFYNKNYRSFVSLWVGKLPYLQGIKLQFSLLYVKNVGKIWHIIHKERRYRRVVYSLQSVIFPRLKNIYRKGLINTPLWCWSSLSYLYACGKNLLYTISIWVCPMLSVPFHTVVPSVSPYVRTGHSNDVEASDVGVNRGNHSVQRGTRHPTHLEVYWMESIFHSIQHYNIKTAAWQVNINLFLNREHFFNIRIESLQVQDFMYCLCFAMWQFDLVNDI